MLQMTPENKESNQRKDCPVFSRIFIKSMKTSRRSYQFESAPTLYANVLFIYWYLETIFSKYVMPGSNENYIIVPGYYEKARKC